MTTSPSVFDLRAWLDEARAIGELKDVAGAALDFELAAISDLNAKQRGPALLFSGFPGHAPSVRILTGTMLNARTLGLALSIDGVLDTPALTGRVADLLRDIDTQSAAFPPVVMDDGPVMERRQTGEAVDLDAFPAPIWNALDGGAYIGTGCVQFHRDPDSGWINMGTYRVQRHSRNTLGNFIGPGHHGQLIRQKYWDRGEPCPVVMVFGASPRLLVLGGLDVPGGVDELRWVGALAGRGVPVVRGPITGLPIPADAEIAIEGFVSDGDRQDEGPFGEFTGYYAGGKQPEPVVRVHAVYSRRDPILVGSPPSRPIHDFSYSTAVLRSAAVKESLRKAGVPAVKAVWVSEAGCGRMWVVTSISQKYAGHAAQAANLAVQCQAGGMMNRYSIVVDEDIDPSDNAQVIWALSTRTDPATDIDIVRQCWSNPLDPMLPGPQKQAKQMWNSRAIVNACVPWDRLQSGDFPLKVEPPAGLLEATRRKWASLFDRGGDGRA